MNSKNLTNYLIEAPGRAYESVKSLAKIEFLAGMAGLAYAGYQISEGNGKRAIAGLLVSLAASVYGFYKDNFSSKREPTPECLIPKKDDFI